MFEHISKTSHTSSTNIKDVLDAVVASVAWGHAAQRARIETVFDALSTVGHGLRETAALGGMADGRADPPAAVPALEIGETAGLIAGPLVDAHGHLAGAAVAAETGEDLLTTVHCLM